LGLNVPSRRPIIAFSLKKKEGEENGVPFHLASQAKGDRPSLSIYFLFKGTPGNLLRLQRNHFLLLERGKREHNGLPCLTLSKEGNEHGLLYFQIKLGKGEGLSKRQQGREIPWHYPPSSQRGSRTGQLYLPRLIVRGGLTLYL